MSMPFYVSAEQVMSDKAQFARKGIARGLSLVGMTYADGIALVAENPSDVLHKISEIYDRIGFAGAGMYSEYEQLRRSGVQFCDVTGYQYSREDVDARSLANAYAQSMHHVFTTEIKPLEVELLVAEVGYEPSGDRMFRVTFDGRVVDDDNFTVIGGESEPIAERLKETWSAELPIAEAVKVARNALAGPDRTVEAAQLEVAVLSRSNGRRTFQRIDGEPLVTLLS